ncbi:flagellar basal body P-ring formation chaperone FlgA [Limnoglobus roseus]|uniref:Flagella basal body P-ring formation protein FlgA n=1 Tax=Limnoglobus roseus TaxID=2598579 RepID=A0A5C1A7H3_9BACT|nr:flagellar basal body P-ring formation chaperone FlgA [Limnoglobus roseus]QEL13792.1 flagella basal body P-ring formation protein FlgA [Limnoglobus roseus]
MRTLLLLALFALGGSLSSADPVVVVLPANASSGSAVVTLGQIAKLHGGDDKLRAKLAAVDVAERAKKDAPTSVTKRQVEFRLKLAGFTESDAIVGGAETVAVTVEKKTVPTDDAIAAATKALALYFPKSDGVTVELAQPILVKMPEALTGDAVEITAKPRFLPVKLGRVEMEVTLTINSAKPFSFPVYLTAKSDAHPILVTRNQKVTLVVRLGAMNVEAAGEAMQDGRAGEAVKVLNPSSKKVVTGKVTAAGVVDVELGGAP